MAQTQIVPRPPRVPFVRPVHVSRHDGSSAQWLLASNLSEGGVFVRTAEPPPLGTRLRLDLEARGQTLRFAEAEVIWTRPMDLTRMNQGLPGFGVRFVDLAAESTALVKHLVDVGGTGRGQAKTLPFTSPEAMRQQLREQLHAPVGAMVQNLVPTQKAPTGEWPMLAPTPAPVHARPPPLPKPAPKPLQKVIVDLGAEPLSLGLGPPAPSREPTLDRSMLQAHVAAPPPPRAPQRAGVGSWLAGAALLAVVAAAGVFGWRGLHESINAEPASEPVTRVTAPPEPVASPEGAGEATAATVEPEDSAKEVAVPEVMVAPPAKPAVAAAAPAKPAAKPAAKASAMGEIALPSGAARAVEVSEQGSALSIRPQLSAGSSIDRVFALSRPSRLVIDLKGPAPRGTPRVEGRNGVTSVRLGTRPGGTRLVLDLAREAGHIKTADGDITVQMR